MTSSENREYYEFYSSNAHCSSCQSLTWAPIPMRPSLRHSIAYLYPCPTWPRTQLSGTYGNVQTYKKYMQVKVLLMFKIFAALFFSAMESLSRSNKYSPRQISSQTSNGKTNIFLNIKFRFVLPPLLNLKSGWEPHKDLELVGPRGMWHHMHIPGGGTPIWKRRGCSSSRLGV